MRKQAVVLLCLICMVLLTGCSFKEYIDTFSTDNETLREIADPSINVELEEKHLSPDGTPLYFDDKTGAYVTMAQYYAYNITDAFKLYGLYITIPCFGIGFLIRRFIKNSASLRRLGLVMELAIPFLYVLLAYVMSAIADRI